jgi:hypothetical protein
MKTHMFKTLLLLSLFQAFPLAQSVCFAQNCANGQCRPVRAVANATAQAVAETMARLGKVGHFGGNPYSYEGCAMATTREGAYRNCCYSNSGMKTMDVGYAQDSRGRWYCCRRYSR